MTEQSTTNYGGYGSTYNENTVFNPPIVFEEDGNYKLILECVVGVTTPKEIWETKDVWFQAANERRQRWGTMPEQQQEALVKMTKDALERMHDRIEEWIPEALYLEGGRFIDIHMRFLLTDIDEQVDRNHQATSFQIKAAAEDLKNILNSSDEESSGDCGV